MLVTRVVTHKKVKYGHNKEVKINTILKVDYRGSVGIDGIYKFDTTTVKNLGFDKFIVGRTYEKAWAVESSPNILGRVAYNILDIFHD